jgi:hypothetical protein
VTYDRGEGASGIGCVGFGRTRRGRLTEDLKQPRLRGYKPKRVKVGRIRACYVCGHVCGYDSVPSASPRELLFDEPGTDGSLLLLAGSSSERGRYSLHARVSHKPPASSLILSKGGL